MGLKLKTNVLAYGYITVASGSSQYVSLPAAVGVFSGSFVMDVKFRATSFAHQGLVSKLNPSSGGAGSARGWLLGFSFTAKIKFYFCTADGTIEEFAGTTTLSINTEYIIRLESNGTTVLVRLSSDDGASWNTECAVTDANCISMLADNNTYPVNLSRGRWGGVWGDYFNGRIGLVRIVKGSSDPAGSPTIEYRMATTGSNPAIVDRVGALNGTSYNGVTGTTLSNTTYLTPGSAVYGPYDISAAESYFNSALSWAATLPANTAMTIKTAITATTDAPLSWDTAAVVGTNTSPVVIPGLSEDDDLTGKYLWIKIEASSTVSTSTPELTSLGTWIIGPDYAANIVLTLPNTGRLKFPQGDVTVTYTRVTGGMEGGMSVLVEDWEEDFTPTGIVPVFNPNVSETLTASVAQTVSGFDVDYEYKQGIENITASADISVVVTKVGDLPL